MMFLAVPQPGPPAIVPDSAARAWSLKSEPKERPSIPAPPIRNRSRRVIFRFRSHRSEQVPPEILIIGHFLLIVEQEPGAVNKGPGQVLEYNQAFLVELMRAGHRVLAQLNQRRVEMNRFLRLFQRALQFREFWILGKRFGCRGDRLPAPPKFGVSGSVIVENGRRLFWFALTGIGPRGLHNGIGHPEVQRVVARGHVQTEPAE